MFTTTQGQFPVPAPMEIGAPTAASQPSEGQMPNARAVIPLTPVQRLKEAREFASQTRQNLIAAVVDEVCKVILSDEALKNLKEVGYCNADIRFKNGKPLKETHATRVTSSLDHLVEIPAELTAELSASLKLKINPAKMEFFANGKIPKSFLDSVHIVVSDCQMLGKILIHENEVTIEKMKESEDSYHVHQQGINDIQAKLYQAEQEYLNFPGNEQLVDIKINTVFENVPESPFNKFLEVVKKAESKTPCFRIVFNCEDLDFDKNITQEEKNLITHVSGLGLEDVALFLKKAQANLGILPQLKYIHTNGYADGKPQRSYLDKAFFIYLPSNVSVMAEYHFGDSLQQS